MRNFLMVLTTLCLVAPQPGCSAIQSRTVADVVLPVSQENQLGKQMSTEIENELKLLGNSEINDWVKGMGAQLVKAARDTPKGIQYTFKVVDDDSTVNAFAIPGGTIYVYTGLLKKAENEAEIAAVLGHEIAHVSQRHIAKRLTAMYGVQAVANVALGKNPGLLGELVAGVVANGYLLKHSRDAERDADEVGINYTIRGGFSPMGYVTFFEKLAAAPQPPAFISSHPAPKERVENARQEIRQMAKGVRNRPVGADDYRRRMSAL